MKKDLQIEQEIDKMLQPDDKSQRIECDTFFYTRLMGKIESQDRKREQSKFVSIIRGFLRPALLVIIIVFNILTGVLIYEYSIIQSDTRTKYIKSLAKEFSIQHTDYSLINFNKDK